MKFIVASDVAPAEAGMSQQRAMVDEVAASPGAAALMLWRSQPAIIVTRADERLPAYEDASEQMWEAGWPVLVRTTGGGAFPLTPGTIQIATAMHAANEQQSIDLAYTTLAAPILATLAAFGLNASIGTVPRAFCGGRHDIVVAGRKIAGMAQHWRRALGGSICVVGTASLLVDEAPERLADVVNRFYDLAGGHFRCAAEAVTGLQQELGRFAPPGGDLIAAVVGRLAAALPDGVPQAA